MEKRTKYCYVAYSLQGDDTDIVHHHISRRNINDKGELLMRPFWHEHSPIRMSFIPIFRMKDCPDNIHDIKSREDVIKYDKFLKHVMHIFSTKFINSGYDSTLADINEEYEKLHNTYPAVFGKKITYDEIQQRIRIDTFKYILLKHKSNIVKAINIANKNGTKVKFLDGCDVLFSQCKKYLPIYYGMFYDNNSLCIFSTKSPSWETKYGLNERIIVNNENFFAMQKMNEKRLRIHRINGFY